MGNFKSEVTHEFDGKKFNQVPLKAKKQDGFNQQSLSVFVEVYGNELVIVNNGNDVVARIIGDSLTVIPVE